MSERAIKLSRCLTASETDGRILLFLPTDFSEPAYTPAQEIWLSKEEIKRLYEWTTEINKQV